MTPARVAIHSLEFCRFPGPSICIEEHRTIGPSAPIACAQFFFRVVDMSSCHGAVSGVHRGASTPGKVAPAPACGAAAARHQAGRRMPSQRMLAHTPSESYKWTPAQVDAGGATVCAPHATNRAMPAAQAVAAALWQRQGGPGTARQHHLSQTRGAATQFTWVCRLIRSNSDGPVQQTGQRVA